MKQSQSGSSSVDRSTHEKSSTPVHAHPFKLPWGPASTLELELPSGLQQFELHPVWPDLAGPVGDYLTALEGALEAPLQSPPLEAW